MKKNRGTATFEYIFIFIFVIVVAIIVTFFYRKYFLKRGFEATTSALEFDEESQEVASFRKDTENLSKFKLTTPLVLAVICGFILMIIIASTIKSARKNKRTVKDLQEDENGQALTEFIIVFPLLLFITLCLMQLSLAYTGRLIVNYSAFSACRAAVVYIPMSMGEKEPAGTIELDKDEEREKLGKIKDAARLSCMPAAARMSVFLDSIEGSAFGGSLNGFFDVIGGIAGFLPDLLEDIFSVFGEKSGKYASYALDRYLYSYFFTDVKILDENFDELKVSTSYSRDPVTVRVTHQFRLSVPLANAFFGKKMNWDLFETIGLDSFDLLSGSLDSFNVSASAGYVIELHGDCTMHVAGKVGHNGSQIWFPDDYF